MSQRHPGDNRQECERAQGGNEREFFLLLDSNEKGKKMIMIVEAPGSQVGSRAAAGEGGEGRGGGRGESGERRGAKTP